jgi:SAM-dependent methyltransferase
MKRQISEPLEELALRSQIPNLTAITNEVSQSVRDQYEESPFPRWINAATDYKGRTIGALLEGPPLRFDIGDYQSPDSPEILIAGCGTGQHSLLTASRFANARVLAVDLSLSSLSYALRKTKERDVPNIEYAQADIMELGNLDRRFDLIDCSGVLHHLGEPLAGWRVLLDLLRPGGLMKIGLYSETARRNIVRGRSFIAEMGYATSIDDIRRCRQDIMAKAKNGDSEMAAICAFNDFFNLSNCRDLLFHVQEHRFTLPQIAEVLESMKLKFIGFEMRDQSALRNFKAAFPQQRALTSLSQWHKFEQNNPDTFSGMYQFWCHKI